MYRYKDQELVGGKRAHKVHKLEWGQEHHVMEGFWQVNGTNGNGVLWQNSVPSLGVTCQHAAVDVPWSTCYGHQSSLPCTNSEPSS